MAMYIVSDDWDFLCFKIVDDTLYVLEPKIEIDPFQCGFELDGVEG